MGRYYEMLVTVDYVDLDKVEDIKEALANEWEQWDDDWYLAADLLTGCGKGSLRWSESEEEFAKRVAEAAWKANGKFCEVDVCTTLLEDLPYERYNFAEEEYTEITGKEAE